MRSAGREDAMRTSQRIRTATPTVNTVAVLHSIMKGLKLVSIIHGIHLYMSSRHWDRERETETEIKKERKAKGPLQSSYSSTDYLCTTQRSLSMDTQSNHINTPDSTHSYSLVLCSACHIKFHFLHHYPSRQGRGELECWSPTQFMRFTLLLLKFYTKYLHFWHTAVIA